MNIELKERKAIVTESTAGIGSMILPSFHGSRLVASDWVRSVNFRRRESAIAETCRSRLGPEDRSPEA